MGANCKFVHLSGPADISIEMIPSSTTRRGEGKERRKRKPMSPQCKQKQPSHRDKSDDRTPERKASSNRKPLPRLRNSDSPTRKKPWTHSKSPSPHTNRSNCWRAALHLWNNRGRTKTPGPYRKCQGHRTILSLRISEHHSSRRTPQWHRPMPSPRRLNYHSSGTRTPSREKDRKRPKSPESRREPQGRCRTPQHSRQS